MIRNAPKYCKTDRNISLGSNRVDWVHLLRKIPTWLRGTNFTLIVPVHPVLHRVSCSYETITNVPKHYTMHQNKSLGSNGVVQVRLLWKITTWFRGTNFSINCNSLVCFASSFMQLRNYPKCTKTLWNAPKHEFRVQWGRSGAFIAKIITWLRGTNFCNNCTSSTHFAPSFMHLRNDPKCIQALWNKPKHEFRVQWGGSSAIVVKNYNVTSGHELLY